MYNTLGQSKHTPSVDVLMGHAYLDNGIPAEMPQLSMHISSLFLQQPLKLCRAYHVGQQVEQYPHHCMDIITSGTRPEVDTYLLKSLFISNFFSAHTEGPASTESRYLLNLMKCVLD